MTNLQGRFIQLKKEILEKKFSRMNPVQREAVFHAKGPLLILAGAGSGKTTVLVNRVACLIGYGDAYHSEDLPPDISEDDITFLEQFLAGRSRDEERLKALVASRPVRPWNILAITFTNKAAGELKSRLSDMLGEETGRDVNAATFHSACVRILRREIERLGYTGSFAIYDTDDSLRVIKDAMSANAISDKQIAPRAILSAISRAKDQMQDPGAMLAAGKGDFRVEQAAKVYAYYQTRLKEANAVDFDDLILLTVRLFQQFPEVLEKYQERYRYIMVDEYQDTNHAQFLLVSALAGRYKNICVVGDDDQSIYKFRGATIENILSFESHFPGAKVVRLEQNYRCTRTILDAANAVISHNTERKGKTLWTDSNAGEPVQVVRTTDEQEEARFVADAISDYIREGGVFSGNVVLYRMNAQSAALERAFIQRAIPYRIVGGVRFFERKEIKDIIAYLSVVSNPSDTLRLERIINEPKRGIGQATIASAEAIAAGLGITLFEAIAEACSYPALARKSGVLEPFAGMMNRLMRMVEEGAGLDDIFDGLLEKSGYVKALQAQGVEGQTRLENIEELKSTILRYMEENEEPTLSGFLEEVALYTDLDSYNDHEDRVVLMTMHSAKGLEFEQVFLVGAEEGIFPGVQSMYDPREVEEERRLAYVAITRAKKKLFMLHAAQRMLFGSTNRNTESRFVKEIPASLCNRSDLAVVAVKRPVRTAAPKKTYSSGGIGVTAGTHETIDISPGDTVRHKAYGEGIVASVTPMGNDYLVEVLFDGVGAKKIMNNFARLVKL